MARLDWREFEQHAKVFFEGHFQVDLREQMPVPVSTGEKHKFDLASADETIIIECKSYVWTKSGNYPSAKIEAAQHCVELLHKTAADKKIIAFQDDKGSQGSLAEVFVRRNRSLLTGIQVWRFLDDRFDKIADYPSSSRPGKLEILFDGNTKPFFEEQDVAVRPAGVVRERRYRIGIRNIGSRVIQKACVVLEACEPNTQQGIHLGHTLQVMGKPRGTDEFSVHPDEQPSAFVDVVYDETVGGVLPPHTNAFGLCYAAPLPDHAILRGSYILTLRVDGGQPGNRKRFKISQHPTTKFLTMCELGSD